jgi:hypothetical protein
MMPCLEFSSIVELKRASRSRPRDLSIGSDRIMSPTFTMRYLQLHRTALSSVVFGEGTGSVPQVGESRLLWLCLSNLTPFLNTIFARLCLCFDCSERMVEIVCRHYPLITIFDTLQSFSLRTKLLSWNVARPSAKLENKCLKLAAARTCQPQL